MRVERTRRRIHSPLSHTGRHHQPILLLEVLTSFHQHTGNALPFHSKHHKHYTTDRPGLQEMRWLSSISGLTYIILYITQYTVHFYEQQIAWEASCRAPAISRQPEAGLELALPPGGPLDRRSSPAYNFYMVCNFYMVDPGHFPHKTPRIHGLRRNYEKP